MNKIITTLLMMLICSTVFAEPVEIDGIYYNLDASTKEAEVAKYITKQYSGTIAIPKEITREASRYSVTSIANQAFIGCFNLTSITIPSSIKSIGNSAFNGCDALSSIKVDADNVIFDSREGCNAIIETSSNTVIKGCKNTTIPNSVTGIGNAAFFDVASLTSIFIPNSVTKIGNDAFNGCSGLTNIIIPNSVVSIGNSAFSGCTSLYSITILSETLGMGTFSFALCGNLQSFVLISSTPPSDYFTSFFYESATDNATLYVPAGSKAAYQAADGWKDFSQIVEIGSVKGDVNGDGDVTAQDASLILQKVAGKADR